MRKQKHGKNKERGRWEMVKTSRRKHLRVYIEEKKKWRVKKGKAMVKTNDYINNKIIKVKRIRRVRKQKSGKKKERGRWEKVETSRRKLLRVYIDEKKERRGLRWGLRSPAT
jgi:hypothetical protein